MKKQLLFLGMLLTGAGAFAQINTQGNIVPSINGQNPFLDASGYNAVGNSIAKGLYFPSADLTKWEFNVGVVNPSTFSSYFDGMVVYNSGTGKTLADTSKGGKQVEVTPGFYYFKNPGQSFPVGSVANGQWVRLGAEAVAGTTLGTLPRYSTEERDKLKGVAEGTIIYNTTTKKVEVYNGTSWDTVSGVATTNPGGGTPVSPGTGVTPPGGGVQPPSAGTDPSTGGGTQSNPGPGVIAGGINGGGSGTATISATQDIYVPSLKISNYQGVIRKITVSIPYTGGRGTYDVVDLVASNVRGEGGDVNDIRLKIIGGTFSSSGTVTGEIEVRGADNAFNVTKLDPNVFKTIASFTFKLGTQTQKLNVIATGGVTDKMYNVKTHNKLEHQFVYVPIISPKTGRIWLNNNLGAEYAKVGSKVFAPEKHMAGRTDKNAAGSLFQWQREPDGAELVDWSGSSPRMVYSGGPWRTDTHSYSALNLWQKQTANNPCPAGYHVPTISEWVAEGPLEYRNAPLYPLAYGHVVLSGFSETFALNSGSDDEFWTSTSSNATTAKVVDTDGWDASQSFNKSWGLPVRCIKD
ncbi:fibrobacter succinogenes major paralogous domain-containing protein [Ornithobacterium rhinotracheale]|uniref:fibrobacter succinogenes major paralogous domain-containing protein n=1 Tax=Ornithobacterium rhinotracheale TaxID=28251 RepID=UPI002159683A|nr:fibrobacter succinogenes major paralogous domain-containing protein [Ornithobacterium rhinotracheale]UVD86318.1 fibrobacter succinogenes major paralogous domain-containing protein [Ornithobacterium rhinotracheale]UVD87795.1 fibrobacter succinogenes major paralogous domain-containing protein [Ornithobacterium rhinotracheale]